MSRPEPRDWYAEVGLGPTSNPTPPMTAAELMAMEFGPTRWVVPDVLPEGVTLLAAKPKKGKSWMALGLCEAIAAGGVAFGTRRVDQGDALYLALEDNPKRLQKRLRKVLDGAPAPDRMHLHTEWPRLDEGGAEALDEWLTAHPGTRLVVIDTLAKVRQPARGANVYAEDYAALEKLLPMAAKHGVAIVVIHHLRKGEASDAQDEISGSTGLSGGVDGYMILRRKPGSKGPTLLVDGRDIEEPEEYALHWNHNTASWTIEGEAEEVHLSKERADILLTLNRAPEPMTPKEVTEALGPSTKYGSVKKLMWTMLGDGQLIKNDKGAYYPANPTTPTDSGNRGNRGNSGNPGNPGNPTSGGSAAVTGLPRDNGTGNPTLADVYAENGASVTEVTGDFAPLAHSEPPRQGSEEKGGSDGASGSAKPPFAAGGSARGSRLGGNDVVGTSVADEDESRIQWLMRGGWSAYAARAEVLAKDHPLDCECVVCM